MVTLYTNTRPWLRRRCLGSRRLGIAYVRFPDFGVHAVPRPRPLTEPARLAVALAGYMCNLCSEIDLRCVVLDKISERLPANIWQL
jgi:hypothetical protein